MDQRIGSYTVKTKSKRWTIAAFAYVIDTARVNAGTLFSLKKNTDPRKLNSFQFGLDLARSLVLPHLKRRKQVGLQKNILNKMKICLDFLQPEDVEIQNVEDIQNVAGGVLKFPSTSETGKRCAQCVDGVAGTEHKKKKNKLGKVQRRCQNCDSPICTKHMYMACAKCSVTFVVRNV